MPSCLWRLFSVARLVAVVESELKLEISRHWFNLSVYHIVTFAKLNDDYDYADDDDDDDDDDDYGQLRDCRPVLSSRYYSDQEYTA